MIEFKPIKPQGLVRFICEIEIVAMSKNTYYKREFIFMIDSRKDNKDKILLRKLQKIDLDIAKTVIQICEEEGLRYFMVDGTMLGAVRHHGYIPWDDDMDLAMPRPDYERFMEIAPSRLSDPYVLRCYQNDSNYKIYFCGIANSRYKLFRASSKKQYIVHPWIDIFPLDGMPDKKIVRRFHQMRLLFLRMLYDISVFDEIVNIKRKNRVWYEKVIIWFCIHIPLQRVFDYRKRLGAMDKALKKYSYDESNIIVDFLSVYRFREMFSKEVFGNGRDYEFDNTVMKGPAEAHRYLSQVYGDYMTPPSEDERRWHHAIDIVDL